VLVKGKIYYFETLPLGNHFDQFGDQSKYFDVTFWAVCILFWMPDKKDKIST